MKHGLRIKTEICRSQGLVSALEGKTPHLANVDIGYRETCGHGGRGAAKGSMCEPPVKGMKLRPGMFAQRQRRHLWSKASEFKAGQAGKEREEKMIEVHLKFYTLVFIYVVFLEGAAWTAEGLCKSPTKNRIDVAQSY